MKKITPLIFFSIGLLFLLFCGTLNAQEKKKFKPRFSEAVNGNVTMIANNMLSRNKLTPYNGTYGNHSYTNNVFVDIDNDNTTFNSSSANFTNPEPSLSCLSIKKVYLYWAAADKEEENSANELDWNYNQVKIKLPTKTNYQTITADEVIYRGRDEQNHFINDPYVCVKDITNNVNALNSAYGTYQIANVRAKKGKLTSHGGGNTGTSGGWQIVFVYESPTLPAKNISLFDGYGHITRELEELEINFTGFQTVPGNQQVNANVVFGALEGDRDLSGDKLQIKKVNNTWTNLSYSLRGANNFFNSKIAKNGTNFMDRNPASTNTLGFDADVFPLYNPNNSIIGNNQNSATIRLTSNQETYGLFLIGLAIDVWKPNLEPLLLNSSVTTVNSGDIVDLSFNVKNNGNDDVRNLAISAVLPEEVDLIEPIVGLPNGVSYAYNSTTRILNFSSINGITDINDVAYTINYQVKIKEQCYFLKEACSNQFQIQMEADYRGKENKNNQTTLSSNTTNTCGIGDRLPTIITINKPSEAIWETAINTLDRKIACDDETALNQAQLLEPEASCSLTVTKTSGDFIASNNCPILGTYTNTWVFTDSCGRVSENYTQTITIEDIKAPVIECPTVATSYTIDEGKCSYTETFEAIATDNCNTIDYEYTINGAVISFPYAFPVGETIVSVKATDTCGNISESCSFNVNVIDNIPPTVICPEDINVNTDNNSCFATVNLIDPITNDNCGVVNVTNNAPSTFPVGITIVTWTVTDTNGLITNCTQKITVKDNILPTITCPIVAANYSVDLNECSYLGSFEAMATDNCAIENYTYTVDGDEISFPYNFPFGNTQVTVIAIDVNGNRSKPCDFLVKVIDDRKPILDETNKTNIDIECGVGNTDLLIENWLQTNAGITAIDNCETVTWSNNYDKNIAVNCDGNYINVTFTATDANGNTSSTTAGYLIKDTVAPILVKQASDVTAECDGKGNTKVLNTWLNNN